MTDREFLIWLHQRLAREHGESAYVDYMHFLRDIIGGTPNDRCSRGNKVTMRSMDVLYEIRKMEATK